MTTTMHRRLAQIEALITASGCATCRDWLALVIQMSDEPEHPADCPSCGRHASHVIRITQRDDGPQ